MLNVDWFIYCCWFFVQAASVVFSNLKSLHYAKIIIWQLIRVHIAPQHRPGFSTGYVHISDYVQLCLPEKSKHVFSCSDELKVLIYLFVLCEFKTTGCKKNKEKENWPRQAWCIYTPVKWRLLLLSPVLNNHSFLITFFQHVHLCYKILLNIYDYQRAHLPHAARDEDMVIFCAEE